VQHAGRRTSGSAPPITKANNSVIVAHTATHRTSTVGARAFIHYGVTIADHAMIATDAFLMKGEEVTPGTRWSGNPARPIQTPLPALQTEPRNHR
jgi:acetyltransferase-like isoleucine patch superfamily enzyme